jgi:hypothetical protein
VDTRLLEGIAREAWESTGSLLPVDAFELAWALGVTVVPWRKAGGSREDDTVWYPQKARPVRQHGTVAHELGHWLLEQHRLDARDEASARYLAGALLLPRVPFLADLAATDWDLFELQRRHPNASAEMVVVRMTQVSEATAWVWDAAKLARRYGLDADDSEAAPIVDRVLELERPLAAGPVRAWPVFDGRFRRVIVVRRAA